MNQSLVSSKWLHENLDSSALIILDASQKDTKSELTSEFGNLKIKGAKFFDLKNAFSDQTSQFPNTFPSADQFEMECQKLGINRTSRIIVYDNLGVYTSPRVWWMFKAMGHEEVYVLNGGLPDWISNGFEVESLGDSPQLPGNFKAKLQSGFVKGIDFIQSNAITQKNILIDARSSGRFNGTAKEPREGLRSGHIPNSINIPFTNVLENGKYKSETELRELFEETDMDERPLIFSCGSGVTACIVLLAAEMVLDNKTAIYDGSWTEWATLVEDIG
jgi:thiosulfate/3-mercaptopyruvate sulfurtransferase